MSPLVLLLALVASLIVIYYLNGKNFSFASRSVVGSRDEYEGGEISEAADSEPVYVEADEGVLEEPTDTYEGEEYVEEDESEQSEESVQPSSTTVSTTVSNNKPPKPGPLPPKPQKPQPAPTAQPSRPPPPPVFTDSPSRPPPGGSSGGSAGYRLQAKKSLPKKRLN